MEGDQGELSSPSASDELTFADFADTMCPHYLAAGMTYDEFWHGNYAKLPYYRELFELKSDQTNRDAWLQGGYIFDAVSVALDNAFRKNGARPKPYLDKPYELTKEEKSAATPEEKAIAARKKIVSDLSAWADNWKSVYGGDKK